LLVIFAPNLMPFGRNNIIILGISSYLLQSIKFLIYKKKVQENKFYLVGNIKEIDYFKRLIIKMNMKNNFKLINFSNQKKRKLENQSIIIFSKENNEEQLEFIYRNYLTLNLNLYTPFDWCEKYLHRIPTIYLLEKEYEMHQWSINSDSFQWRLKRFGDLFISLLLIIISSPLILISSLLIWLEDKGPIFYSQIRTGLNGKEFKITKLRTMKVKSELNGPVWASKNDHRITKIGSILRKSRVDELPQLISVLIGDMSLIGPRPERPSIEILLKEKIKYYEIRQVMRPGLSGWAQVNYPYGASLEDSSNKLSFELFYIRNYSFWLDLLIFFKTIKLVLNMKGAHPLKK
jgi:lipopolysaccharide/colanic/teichoic acid biosynthesis glycosyltransferase